MAGKKKHPILKVVLGIFVVLVLLGALGSGGDKKEATKAPEPAPVEEAAETAAEEPAEEPAPTEAPAEEPATVETPVEEPAEEPAEEPVEEKTEYGVGDTLTQNDITVTFLGVTETRGSAYNKPSEGNVYVLCEFEITNNKSTDLGVSSMMNFEVYCDDYSTSLSLGALIESGNKSQLDGTIASGKKMKGVVGYEIPADWTELEIHYTPSGLFAKEFTFIANHE